MVLLVFPFYGAAVTKQSLFSGINKVEVERCKLLNSGTIKPKTEAGGRTYFSNHGFIHQTSTCTNVSHLNLNGCFLTSWI